MFLDPATSQIALATVRLSLQGVEALADRVLAHGVLAIDRIYFQGAAMSQHTGLSQIALATALVLLPPLAAPLDRRYHRSNPGTLAKLTYFAITCAFLWALTAAAVSIDGWQTLLDGRIQPITWLPFAAITAPVFGTGSAVFLALSLMPLIQSLRGARHRRAYAAAYMRNPDVAGLLPLNAVERMAFILVSLTAGICEEALYRGYLIHFLHQSPLALSLVAALLLSSFAFGLGHLYQGWSGVLKAGLVGLVLGLVYLLSGSLIPAMILHALIDMQAVVVFWPTANEGPAAAEPA